MIAPATKTCSSCGDSKPVTAFYASKTNPMCRECTRAYQRDWYRRNRGPTYIECRKCGRKLQTRGVRGVTLETGVCANCRRPKGSGSRLDHDAICRRLKDGPPYRDIAKEFGCALASVKAIASKYGLQRMGKRPVSRHELRITDSMYKPPSIAYAVEAQRECWDYYRRGQGRKPAPYAGVTADQIIDGMTEDLKGRERWRGRITLLCRVLDMARQG